MVVSTSCKKSTAVNDNGQTNGTLKVGDTPPNFSEENSQGVMISLEDFRGKIIVLSFGAMWCGPCRSEVPELVQAYNSYKAQGVEILQCVYQDEDSNPADLSDLARWIAEFNITFTVFKDEDRSTVDAYKFHAIPFSVLIDRDFVIREIFIGYTPGDVLNAIRDLL
jgi:peroxiredoxin